MALLILVTLADESLNRRTLVLNARILISNGEVDHVGSRQSQYQRGRSHEGGDNRLLEKHGGNWGRKL